MKKIVLALTLLFMGIVGYSQVKPFTGTLNEAISKAKSENKMVILMATASWERNTKAFEWDVLRTEEAKEYLDSKYIFLMKKLDVDDSENIRITYNIAAYPQFIIFNSDRQELNRFTGVTESPESFIALVEESIKPGNTFLDYEKKIKENPSLAIDYAKKLQSLQLLKKAQDVADSYFESLNKKERYSADNIAFYNEMISDANSVIFSNFINKKSAKRIVKAMGKEEYTNFVNQKSDAIAKGVAATRHLDATKVDEFVKIAKSNEAMHTPFIKFVIENSEQIKAKNPDLLKVMATVSKDMEEKDIDLLMEMLNIFNARESMKYKSALVELYTTAISKSSSGMKKMAYEHALQFFKSR